MSDLISRQAAIYAVGYYSLHSGDKLLFADKPLKELPSADAVERKRGKWIDLGKDRIIRWQCSECGRKDTHIYNYCPDCGAEMRGEANEHDQ